MKGQFATLDITTNLQIGVILHD